MPLLILWALLLFLPGLASLPPMDRDEPRFAQASKQMLETSDFIDIRFGTEARNKKPVGIHWMQVMAVGAAELVRVPDARGQLWLYRFPSLLGGVAAVVFTFWAGLALVSRRGAVAAGMILAATMLLSVESRLATTDAVLVATVAAAMGALARAYLVDDRAGPSLATASLFWIALGVGILVKGPITPMIVAFAVVALSLEARSLSWLSGLRPAAGILLCLLIVLPWFVLILIRTDGAFFVEALGHDLLAKVGEAQEMHDGLPGSYLAAFWVSGWPLAPFAALAAPALWRHRGDRNIVFLAAWLIPAWLVFEAVPTKLFHYVLPLYPALAILAVAGLERVLADGRRFLLPAAFLLATLLAVVPLAILGLVFAMDGWLWTLSVGIAGGAILATVVVLALAWSASRSLLRGAVHRALATASLAALPIYLFVFGWLLTPEVADRLDVASRLAVAATAANSDRCPDPLYATVGDREPSLVFETDANLLMTDPAGAARFLAEGPCRVAFVERREEPAFVAALDPGLPVQQASRVDGVGLGDGKSLDIGIYIRQ